MSVYRIRELEDTCVVILFKLVESNLFVASEGNAAVNMQIVLNY